MTDIAVRLSPASSIPRHATTFWILAGSLFVTGAASLIYQVVWFRSLGTIFGVTVYATSAVLAAFMAGLAIGSALVGQLVPRIRRPLFAYGVAELIIGMIGLISLPALDLLQNAYRALAQVVDDPAPARFVLALVVLLLPTTLMGATLPLALAGVSQVNGARRASILYATNTAGAIAGAAGSAYFIIGSIGLSGAVLVAVAANIAVGLLWMVLGRTPVDQAEEISHVLAVGPVLSRKLGALVLVVYAVSGGAALANEVVWTRTLSSVYPGTVYAFATMLAVLLAGIAAGSAIAARFIERRYNWFAIFALLEIAIGALCLLAMVTFGQAYRLDALLRSFFGRGPDELLVHHPFFMILFTILAIGPASFALGVAFPVAARVYGVGGGDSSRRVARIYAVNTLGGIVGSLVGGLLLIPLFGAQRSLWLLATVNVLAGVVLALAGSHRTTKAVAVGGLALAVVTFFVMPDISRTLIATHPRGEQIVWQREGQDVTVSVVRTADQALELRTNSNGHGSDRGGNLLFHYELGHYASLFAPPVERPNVLIIGLGLGSTAGAAAQHPNNDLTIVELHPGVIEAASQFEHANYRVLHQPNVRAFINDGRNELLLDRAKYDAIAADVILPTNQGAANLYSADFYRLVRNSLTDDGVMIQWVNPNFTGTTYRMMIRTFLSVFPDATLWREGSILVGSRKPLSFNEPLMNQRISNPAVRDALAEVGIRSAADIQKRFTVGSAELKAFVGDGPVITDREPWIEYYWSIPNVDPPGSSVRSVQAVETIRRLAQDGDAIVYGNDRVREVFAEWHRLSLPHYAPPDNANDAETRDAITRLRSTSKRIWYIPFPGTRTSGDESVERALGSRPSYDAQLAETRVFRFDN